ncbi:MAG: isoprenylcysteine carboxylmethyltransferase family protein [Candidatus Saccharimonadales bacterium]|jgi:protein-S-isoprenylcysteine O-methyltransferase
MDNLTWLIIQTCWVIFLVYWVVKAFDVKRTAIDRGNPKLRLFLTLLVLLVIIFQPFRSTFFNNQLWKPMLTLDLLADIIVITGLVFAITARFTLGSNWSPHTVLKQGQELIENGPYAIVRHPIYTGILFMAIGTTIRIDQIFGFVLLVLVCLVLWSKILSEEKLMQEHFPKQYQVYRQHVKAIIPFIF